MIVWYGGQTGFAKPLQEEEFGLENLTTIAPTQTSPPMLHKRASAPNPTCATSITINTCHAPRTHQDRWENVAASR